MINMTNISNHPYQADNIVLCLSGGKYRKQEEKEDKLFLSSSNHWLETASTNYKISLVEDIL
jgi:hypothetical protein